MKTKTSKAPERVAKGDVVWAKYRKQIWPSIVLNVYKKPAKATFQFFPADKFPMTFNCHPKDMYAFCVSDELPEADSDDMVAAAEAARKHLSDLGVTQNSQAPPLTAEMIAASEEHAAQTPKKRKMNGNASSAESSADSSQDDAAMEEEHEEHQEDTKPPQPKKIKSAKSDAVSSRSSSRSKAAPAAGKKTVEEKDLSTFDFHESGDEEPLLPSQAKAAAAKKDEEEKEAEKEKKEVEKEKKEVEKEKKEVEKEKKEVEKEKPKVSHKKKKEAKVPTPAKRSSSRNAKVKEVVEEEVDDEDVESVTEETEENKVSAHETIEGMEEEAVTPPPVEQAANGRGARARGEEKVVDAVKIAGNIAKTTGNPAAMPRPPTPKIERTETKAKRAPALKRGAKPTSKHPMPDAVAKLVADATFDDPSFDWDDLPSLSGGLKLEFQPSDILDQNLVIVFENLRVLAQERAVYQSRPGIDVLTSVYRTSKFLYPKFVEYARDNNYVFDTANMLDAHATVARARDEDEE